MSTPKPSEELLVEQLMPLCPCRHNGANMDAERDCPVHGDGVTFVAYVRGLEKVLHAARGWTVRLPIEVRQHPPAAMSPEAIDLMHAVAAVDALDVSS